MKKIIKRPKISHPGICLMKPFLSLLAIIVFNGLTQFTVAQENITIVGKVTDTDGTSLTGASVVISGTTIGTVTDIEGNFKLSVPNEKSVLEISFIGYESKSLTVGNQTNFTIMLQPDLKNLDEVVVIGYGSAKKSDLTGSISSVSSKEIKDRSVLSIDQALQGNVAGVQVTQNSGAPGASVMVRIRGMGTINNNDPLYVVDGIPIDAVDINFLNPNDIENVQILKDASAAAIYGSRGANGVIVITTKKGKQNTSEINFEAYYGVQNITNSPDVMSSDEFVRFMYENELPGATIYGHPDSDTANYNNFNWWDAITVPGRVQNYNLSILGGNEKNTYNFSTDYYKNEGAIKNTNYQRLSVRINNEFRPLKRLTISQTLAITMSGQNGSVTQGQFTGSDWGNSVTAAYMADPMTVPYNEDGDFNGLFTKVSNPMIHLDLDMPNDDRKIYRLIGNVNMQINLAEGLNFNSNISTVQKFDQQKTFYEAFIETGKPGRPINSVSESFRNTSSINWFNTLSYDFNIKTKHEFKLMAGQEYQHTMRSSIPVSGDSIPGTVDEFQYIYLSKNAVYTGSGNPWDRPSENALISYFGRLNYTYNNLILLTATLRRDGSSRFGKEEKWGIFPSYAVAFKVSELDVIKGITSISNLKIRAGYGKVGNQEIGDYTWASFFQSKTDYNNNEDILYGSSLRTQANAAVAWESQNSTNIGLDLGILNNMILFNIDFFQKITEGVLYPVTLPLITGLPEPSIQNIADIENKGFEFSLNYRNYEGMLGYNVGLNFSKYKNKVLDLGGANYLSVNPYKSSLSARIEEGLPIASFYGWKTDGLYKDWADVAENGFNNSRPGDVKYIDLNDDKILDNEDKMFIGSPHPDYTLGFNLGLQYRQFELTSNAYASVGNDIHYNIVDYIRSGTASWNQDRYMLDAWTPENNHTGVPRFGNTASNTKHPSDLFIFDGSYLRLKRLQLSYTLPAEATQKIKVKNMTIYGSVENLFTISKYPGLEPEIGLNTYRGGSNDQLNLGIDAGTFPQPRTFLIGLKIKI